MYLSFYHLKHKPFQISTDPRFLWLGEKHEEALATLRYGVADNKGFLLLTGDVGTGKTTLINALINSLDQETYVAFIRDPALDPLEFFQYTAHAFGMKASNIDNKVSFLIQFERFLLEAYNNKRKVLLIIDEAQRMSQELLEEVRLLSNIEKEESKLINIFFIGQIEFNEILLLQENRAIRQRVTISYNIETLTEQETHEYIKHRLNVASTEKIVTSLTPLEQKTNGEYVRQGYTIPLPDSHQEIFTQDAIREIYAFTQGYPRVINIICDRALLTGYVEGSRRITRKHISECVRELEITHGQQNMTTTKKHTTAEVEKRIRQQEPCPQKDGAPQYIRESVPKTYDLAEVSAKARAADNRAEQGSGEILRELEALTNNERAGEEDGEFQIAIEADKRLPKNDSAHRSKLFYLFTAALVLAFILYYGFAENGDDNFSFRELLSSPTTSSQKGESSAIDTPEAPAAEEKTLDQSVNVEAVKQQVNLKENTQVTPEKTILINEPTSAFEIDKSGELSDGPPINEKSEDDSANSAHPAETQATEIDKEREQIDIKIRQLRELITFQKLTIPFSAETNLPRYDSLEQIDTLIDSLLAHPSFKVTLTYVSSGTLNSSGLQSEAQYRARVVKNYLIGKGLAANRIDLKIRNALPIPPSSTGKNTNPNNTVELFVSR